MRPSVRRSGPAAGETGKLPACVSRAARFPFIVAAASRVNADESLDAIYLDVLVWKGSGKMSTTGLPERRLSMWDCTSIIVGIISARAFTRLWGWSRATSLTVEPWPACGSSADCSPCSVRSVMPNWPRGSRRGGDFVYLTKAYAGASDFSSLGRNCGLFGRARSARWRGVCRLNATQLRPLGSHSLLVYACGSVLVLSALNMLGVRQSTRVQNVLTAAKVLGLALLAIAGMFGTQEVAMYSPPHDRNELVAGDDLRVVRLQRLERNGLRRRRSSRTRRNILRALLLGAAVVTLVYLGLNAACYRMLVWKECRAGSRSRDDGARDWAGHALSVLVCISALGSTNGMIFTGARIYYAHGEAARGVRGARALESAVRDAARIAHLAGRGDARLLLCFGGTAAGNAPHEAFKTAGDLHDAAVLRVSDPQRAGRHRAATMRRAASKPTGFRCTRCRPLVVAVARGVSGVSRGRVRGRFKFDTEAEALRGPTIWVGTSS